MGRIRTVKPEFFLHEELFDLEIASKLPLRIAYIGLWCQADREGRFKWSPRKLKTQILPYDEVDFSRVLDALASRGFVEKYEVEGVEIGVIPTFSEHQVINNREKQSSIPAPDKSNKDNNLTREPREDHAKTTPLKHALAEGKGRERKGILNTNPLSKALPSKKEDDFTEDEKRVLKQKLENFNIKTKDYESKLLQVANYYNSLPPTEKGKFFAGAINMREDGMPIPEEGTFEMNLLLIQRYDKEFESEERRAS